jgi:hypothetical protein
MIKTVITKKMKTLNDGINNLSQQIRGKNKTPSKGTYAQVPTEDVNRQQDVMRRFDEDMINKNSSNEKSNAQLYELTRRDQYDGNDPLDIEHFLKNRTNGIRANAASQIKAIAKRNQNKRGVDAVKSILSKRIAAKKEIQDAQIAAMTDDTTRQYEQLSEQYAKTKAGEILKPSAKRSLANKHYNQAVKMMEEGKIYNDKLKKLRKTQNKNAFEDFASTLKEHRDWKIFKSLPKRTDDDVQGFDINKRNEILTKSLKSDKNMNKIKRVANLGRLSSRVNKQQRQTNALIEMSEQKQKQQKISNFGKLASQTNKLKEVRQTAREKAGAITLQSAIRNRRAKQDYTMRQHQVIGEEQLRQMEAVKSQAIKDDAAKKLQASIKRVKPQDTLRQVSKAKEKIGAVSKRLLTERVQSYYGPESKRTFITNKQTVGQPLVVSKKLKLVSQKKHDAGVLGYETRQDYLDLAKQYKGIMTKGKK